MSDISYTTSTINVLKLLTSPIKFINELDVITINQTPQKISFIVYYFNSIVRPLNYYFKIIKNKCENETKDKKIVVTEKIKLISMNFNNILEIKNKIYDILNELDTSVNNINIDESTNIKSVFSIPCIKEIFIDFQNIIDYISNYYSNWFFLFFYFFFLKVIFFFIFLFFLKVILFFYFFYFF
jgi:hypothetical protein